MNRNLNKCMEIYLKRDSSVIKFNKDSLINFINQNLDKFEKYSENNIDDVPLYKRFYFLEEFDEIIRNELLRKLEVKYFDKYFNFDFSEYDYDTLSNAYLVYISGLLGNKDDYENYNLLGISELIKESHNFISNINNNQNLKDFLLSEYSLDELYKAENLLMEDDFIQNLINNQFFEEPKSTYNFKI